MLTKKYITGVCAISKGIARKNDEVLLKSGTEINSFLLSAYQHLQHSYPKFYKMDNLSKLGWLAAEILLNDGFERGTYKGEDIGVILANANSSLDDDIKYYNTVKDGASPSLFVYTLPNIVTGEICIRNNFKGEQAFYIQGGFDANFVEQQVSYLLDNDLAKCCICGWVDVLGQDYKAVLFLVEQKKTTALAAFSAENIANIFNQG